MPKSYSQGAAVKERIWKTILPLGGLNEDPNPYALADGEFRTLSNCHWNGNALVRRFSEEGAGTASQYGVTPCQGLFSFKTYSSDIQCAIFGSKFYKRLVAGITDITGAVTITSGANNVFTGVGFKNLLIVTNGVDVPIKWTGAGNVAVLGGSPPTAPYIAVKWSRVFMAGMTSDLGIIRYSDVNNPESWPAGNELRIVAAGGEEWITGLAPFRQFLLVMTNRRIYTVTANDGDGVYLFHFLVDRNKPFDIGVAHQRTFVTIGNEAIFLDPDGFVRSLQVSEQFGNLQATSLSRSIQHTTVAGMAQGRQRYAVLEYWPDQEWIVLAYTASGSTSNDSVAVLDLKDVRALSDLSGTPRWTKLTGIAANAWHVRQDPNYPDEPARLFYGTYSGVAKSIKATGSSLGSFTCAAYTKYYDHDLPYTRKRYTDVIVEYETITDAVMTVQASIDGGTPVTVGTINMGSGTSARLPLLGNGVRISILLSFAVDNVTFAVHRIHVGAMPIGAI